MVRKTQNKFLKSLGKKGFFKTVKIQEKKEFKKRNIDIYGKTNYGFKNWFKMNLV